VVNDQRIYQRKVKQMAKFIANPVQHKLQEVPFFEDVSGKDIPGYRTRKSVGQLQNEVSQELALLGANGVYFVEGQYPGEKTRHGYRIHFSVYGNLARVDVAALPIRSETATKRDRALAQALYLVRDKFQALRLAHVHEPSGVPLVPYLIGKDGRTVEESLVASGALPALKPQNGSTPLLEGEVE
jgi:hypothetical protein